MHQTPEETGPPEETPAEGACGLNLAPDERKALIDALLQEIDKTQKWTRLVTEMQAEIARLHGEIDKLRQRLRLADAALRSDSPTLTDAEREAVEWFAAYGSDCPLAFTAALRGLLERTK